MASAATRISTQIHVAANILSFRATESTRRAANRVSTMLISQTPSVTDDLHQLPPDPDNSVQATGLTIGAARRCDAAHSSDVASGRLSNEAARASRAQACFAADRRWRRGPQPLRGLFADSSAAGRARP